MVRPAKFGRRRRSAWWRRPIVRFLLPLVALGVLWPFVRPTDEIGALARFETPFTNCGSGRSQQCVIDGDTISIGFGKAARRIRLTGFDAPELDGACEAERRKALEARDKLRQWLNRADFHWSGGDDPPRDQYGRELREAWRLHPNGGRETLAAVMIDADLASESGWGRFERNWCE